MQLDFRMDTRGLDMLLDVVSAKEITGDVRQAIADTADEIALRVEARAPVVSGALQHSIGLKDGKRSKSPYVAIRALADRMYAVPGHSQPVRPVTYSTQRDLETGFITNAVTDDDVERLRARIEKIVRDVLRK